MKDYATVSLVLDSKEKTDKKRLLKIRVTYNREPRQYTANTDIRLTAEQFENDKLKITKQAKEQAKKALSIAKQLVHEMGKEYTHSHFAKAFKERLFGNHDTSTFANVAEQYIHDPNRGLQLKTKSSYITAVKWVVRFKPHVKVIDINQDFVKGLITFIKKSHLKDCGKDISENTIRIYLRSLKAIYQYAIDLHIVTNNPFCNLIGQPLTPLQRPKGGLTDDELKALNNYTPKDNTERLGYDFFILTCLLCGANIGDILSLKNKNISAKRISFIRRKTSKSQTLTDVPLCEATLNLLNKYGSVNLDKPEEYVLPYLANCDGNETAINNKIHDFNKKINKGLSKICSATGIRHITLYTARHTYASSAISDGMTIEQVQKLLGHTSPQTTRIYINALSENVLNNATTTAMKIIEK